MSVSSRTVTEFIYQFNPDRFVAMDIRRFAQGTNSESSLVSHPQATPPYHTAQAGTPSSPAPASAPARVPVPSPASAQASAPAKKKGKAIEIEKGGIVFGWVDTDAEEMMGVDDWPKALRTRDGKVLNVNLVPLNKNEEGRMLKPGPYFAFALVRLSRVIHELIVCVSGGGLSAWGS